MSRIPRLRNADDPVSTLVAILTNTENGRARWPIIGHMADNAFDRKVRCEIEVDRPQEAEAAFEVCQWRWSQVAPRTYQVEVPVRGGLWGAGGRARELLLEELRRHGQSARLRWVKVLNVPGQKGDRLKVHEVRETRRPRLERLMVALGLRDIGDSLQATDEQNADRQLMLLMSAHGDGRALGWRVRFGQPRLPKQPGSERPDQVRWVVADLVGSFAAGVVLGTFGPVPVAFVLAAVVVPLLAVALAYLRRRPEWALLSVCVAGLGTLGGVSTGERWDVWLLAVAMAAAVAAAAGLRHLLQDLSMAEKAPWLLPMALPAVVPLTTAVGDLAYIEYLDRLGLGLDDVRLTLWDRLEAAALPVGTAFGVSLGLLGIVGWLRYLHFRLPMAVALSLAVVYLISGVVVAADRGASAGRNPEGGFLAVELAWVCAIPAADRVATRGTWLPSPPYPLLALELTGGEVALWLPSGTSWSRRLIKAPTDQLQLVHVDHRAARCQ